jgi:type I restriction enzyme S subunit
MSLAKEFRVGVTTVDATLNQDVKALVPDDTWDGRFIARYLASMQADVLARAETSSHGTKRLPAHLYENLQVPVLALPEQRRVADILDKADEVRRKRKEAIMLTDELLRSTFLNMFGDATSGSSAWPSHSLGSLAALIDYGVTASATAEPVGPKFLRITDIQDDRVDWDTVPYCECDEGAAERARLIADDIVFARTGATTGKSFLISTCPDRAVFASYLIRVRSSPAVIPQYLLGFFQSAAYWSQIRTMAQGAAQPGVNASKLASLVVPVPPLEAQKRFAVAARQIAGIRATSDIMSLECDSLFDSVLSSAFRATGQ